MPPVTATAETEVKTAFFNVYRFERIFGSADAFYEAYYEMTMNAMSTSGRFARLGSEDRTYNVATYVLIIVNCLLPNLTVSSFSHTACHSLSTQTKRTKTKKMTPAA
jgi:hypothetical protein